MLAEFFRKLGKSKWLPWVGKAPLFVFLILVIIDGEVPHEVVVLAGLLSLWIGVFLGVQFGLFISTCLLRASEEFGERLQGAFAVFGFLVLPALVASSTIGNLGIGRSFGAHFLGACVVSGIAFCVAPKPPDGRK